MIYTIIIETTEPIEWGFTGEGTIDDLYYSDIIDVDAYEGDLEVELGDAIEFINDLGEKNVQLRLLLKRVVEMDLFNTYYWEYEDVRVDGQTPELRQLLVDIEAELKEAK